MKNRAVLLAAAVACAIFVLSACAAEVKEDNHSVEVMPLGLQIDSGDLRNSSNGLEPSFMLNRSNGKYAYLYVENNGTNSVVATINGQNPGTIKPGENGQISLEVTQGFLGLDKEYEFKVVAGPNGGLVNIHYEITQRDTQ